MTRRVTRINPHLQDPELYGQRSRRRKYWIFGAILFGAFYGAMLLPLFGR